MHNTACFVSRKTARLCSQQLINGFGYATVLRCIMPLRDMRRRDAQALELSCCIILKVGLGRMQLRVVTQRSSNACVCECVA